MKPRVRIVTPYLADANNGNWRTAERWRRMLAGKFTVIVQARWNADAADCDLLIALHARRSHASIAAFRRACPEKPLIVVLTGTDLYRDLPDDPDARRSLDLADALVVLQGDGVRFLPRRHRDKAQIIYQSCRPMGPKDRPATLLKCVAVGHLRTEKSPETLFEATRLLPPGLRIRIDHIGAPLDKALAQQAKLLAQREPRYRYLGALPHARTRQAMRGAHLLIHPSRMEGGANVIVEAVNAGTAVLASRISGNVGMLGADYPGYFNAGDARQLARMLVRYAEERDSLRRLQALLDRRRLLFHPETERDALTQLVSGLLARRDASH